MKYFLLWELCLYVSFMIGDLWSMPWSYCTNGIKYLAVISCVLYSWFLGSMVQKKRIHSLQFALLYSCCADYFMLFTDDVWLGILGFICVQICYGYSNLFLKVGIVFEIALIYWGIGGAYNHFEIVVMMALCYMVISIWNLVRVKKDILFIGMILLLIGDFFVGLNQIVPSIYPAMWFFYLPSQVCVVMASEF